MATITSRKLRLAGACSEQIALFKALGGDKKKITAKLCAAHASQFDWNWAAQQLLSPEKHAEYERIKAQALAEYRRIEARALAKYGRIEAPAWAEYRRVEAVTFWKLYSAQ
jgi:cell division septum initiation protein DivIVA